VILSQRLVWQPAGMAAPLVVALSEFFNEALASASGLSNDLSADQPRVRGE